MEFGGRNIPAMLAVTMDSEDPSYVEELDMCINPDAGTPVKIAGDIIHETTHVGQLFEREKAGIPTATNLVSFIGITFLSEAHAYSNQVEGPFRQIAALVRKGKTFDAAIKEVPLINQYATSERYSLYMSWHLNGLTQKHKSYFRYEELYNDLKNWATQNSRKPIPEREEQFINARQNFMKNFFSMTDENTKNLSNFYVLHSMEQFKKNDEKNNRIEQRTKERSDLPDVFKTLCNFDKPILADEQWYNAIQMTGKENNKMDVFVHNIVSKADSLSVFEEILQANNDSLTLG